MDSAPQIDSIPVPLSETDALQQDVADLPEAATLDDYARVPITAFWAAMLHGMGWVDWQGLLRAQNERKRMRWWSLTCRIAPCIVGNRSEVVINHLNLIWNSFVKLKAYPSNFANFFSSRESQIR
ncbi:uncharacterized protein EDB93DRAFT_61136 [Suillus bovinus]|uniref:uncharacterized protein n=1 Tax=Suillus bovinus TaxID=48563 RepID=UPI001B8834DE|nr:uncharacterized protein EDB93DRAFT_61136 [Suillus bovinus]KAG2155914.1 hypothetical protein EDB93DRAFT_61136 [Suillus bovinus]